MKTTYINKQGLKITQDVNVPRGGICHQIAEYPDGRTKKVIIRNFVGQVIDWDKEPFQD